MNRSKFHLPSSAMPGVMMYVLYSMYAASTSLSIVLEPLPRSTSENSPALRRLTKSSE